MVTLYEQAFIQEGDPITRDEMVVVYLNDPEGNEVEKMHCRRGDLFETLVKYIGEFAAGNIAEGLPGSVTWGCAEPSDVV